MKTVFETGSANEQGRAETLLLQIGSDHCMYAFLDEQEPAINRLVYKKFNPLQHSAAALFSDIKQVPVKVIAASAFPQALLVPQKYFKNNYSWLDIIYNHPAQKHLHDQVNEWQVVTIYSLPQIIYDELITRFANIKFVHSYTAAIKSYYNIAQPHILLNFTAENFTVLVKKDNQLQLAQTYAYKTPLDAVYYLLKICYEFTLVQTEVHLVVSGLLEKNSALFTELRNYFLHVDFAPPPDLKLPEGDYPHHYFTSLYNLGSCAS